MRLIPMSVIPLLWGVLLVPSVASAQAAIAGTVRDSSGAVIPGVSVEAASPALIEKVRTAVTDGTGQYRVEDLRPGTLRRDVHAAGLQHLQTRGHRADRLVYGHDQRRAQGRHAGGNGHGHRREPDRRRAEREARDDAEQRGHSRAIPTVRNYNSMVMLVPGVVTNANDVATGPLINQFPDPWRPREREPPHRRRAECRQPARRQSATDLRGRRRQLPGGHVHDLGRSRRSGDGRPGDEHRAEDRRQHDRGLGVLQRHRRAHAVRQLHAGPEGRRSRPPRHRSARSTT